MTTIIIRNARLIDGLSPAPREGVDLLLCEGRIAAIGAKLAAPGGSREIDAAGCTVLPGLIDAHVHLAFDGSLDPVGHLLAESPYTTLLKAAANAAQSLRRGVTTVRDLGGPGGLILALREAVRQGIIMGPRILAAGQVITTTGGHCHFMGHQADDLPAVRRAARCEIEQGVDLLKVMATGGSLTPGSPADAIQFGRAEIAAAVDEARARGLRVAAHANALGGLRHAVDAGVTSIEHGSYADRETLERMRELGTFWVPTMAPARIILEGPGAGLIPPERSASAVKNWRARRRAVTEGIRLGVRLAAGTDAGVTITQHGLVALEVETFAALGLPPMQAIWTATRWAAELLGLEAEVGTLAEGRAADLILVRGDPLQDLSLLRQPAQVIQAGAVVECPVPPWPVEAMPCSAIEDGF